MKLQGTHLTSLGMVSSMWCSGGGREEHHRKQGSDERAVTTLSFDDGERVEHRLKRTQTQSTTTTRR